jgi:serine/threonine protein kinase
MADGFPPHHKMPPLRAMMMVPLKEPPTVTDPSKWSNHFNDFVAKCLVKDPKTRPQAMDLLTVTHFLFSLLIL